MKTTTLAVCGVFTLFALQGSAQADLNTGLVAYYPLDGDATDASGNANHGTVFGATSASDRNGNAASALFFDGIDDYVVVPDSDSLDLTTDGTMAVWVRVEPPYLTPPTPDRRRSIITKQVGSSGGQVSYDIAYVSDQSFLEGYAHDGSSNTLVQTTDANLEDGLWHHIAFAWSGSVGTLYYDGQPVGTQTDSSTGAFSNSFPLYLARWLHTTTGLFHHARITLDEVRLYARTLAPAEVTQLAEVSPSCERTELGFWDFEEVGIPAGAIHITDSEGRDTPGALDYDHSPAIAGSESLRFNWTADQGQTLLLRSDLDPNTDYTITALGSNNTGALTSIDTGILLNGANCNFRNLTGHFGFILSDASVTARPRFGTAQNNVTYLFVLKVRGGGATARCEIYDASGTTLIAAADLSPVIPSVNHVGKAGLLGSAVNVDATWDEVNLYEGLVDIGPCCGDDQLDPGEECDDGNNIDGDGCSGECLLENQPPNAECVDPNVDAEFDCRGTASVDNGSSDPDGDPITLDQQPPGPYPLGSTDVTLTVTDDLGASDSCDATVTVVDVTDPEIACNAPDTIVPPDAPISFAASASDNCEGAQSAITGFDCFKFTKKGKRIDKTASCVIQIDGDTINITDSGGVGNQITWTVEATDGSGNRSEVTCEVEVVNPGKKQ